MEPPSNGQPDAASLSTSQTAPHLFFDKLKSNSTPKINTSLHRKPQELKITTPPLMEGPEIGLSASAREESKTPKTPKTAKILSTSAKTKNPDSPKPIERLHTQYVKSIIKKKSVPNLLEKKDKTKPNRSMSIRSPRFMRTQTSAVIEVQLTDEDLAPPTPHSHFVFANQILNTKGEDNYCYGEFRNLKEELIRYYAIFDGHGGKHCAQFTVENLGLMLKKKFKKNTLTDPAKTTEALIKVIKDLDHKWGELATDSSGCTATVFFVAGQEKYIVTVGDSRGIAFDNHKQVAFDLNSEQRISSPEERERLTALAATIGISVLSSGAEIEHDKPSYQILFEAGKSGEISKLQVIMPPKIQQKYHLRKPMCSISLSSTIGDVKLGPIIAPHPVVKPWDLPERSFVILATDGLWDALSTADVQQFLIDICKEHNEQNLPIGELDEETIKNIMNAVSQKLPQHAWNQFGAAENMRDDITVLITVV